MKIIDKARVYQESYIQHKLQRRKENKASYEEFLRTTTRHLPSYETLSKWRRNLFLSAFLVQTPVIIHVLFFFNNYMESYFHDTWEQYIQVICTVTGTCLFLFSITIECVINKRWDNTKPVFFQLPKEE